MNVFKVTMKESIHSIRFLMYSVRYSSDSPCSDAGRLCSVVSSSSCVLLPRSRYKVLAGDHSVGGQTLPLGDPGGRTDGKNPSRLGRPDPCALVVLWEAFYRLDGIVEKQR